MPDVFGGETDAERENRTALENMIKGGYGGAEQFIRGQSFGFQGDLAEEIRGLEALIANPDAYGAPLSADEIAYLKNQITLKKQTLADSQRLAPTRLDLGTSYGVEQYTPEKLTNVSEADIGRGLGAMGIPDYEAAAMQGPSEAAQARADEQGLAAQRAALASMEDIYQQGGLSAIDRARIEEERRNAAQQERAQREAIMSNLAQRGIGGAGMETMALLQAQQGAQDRLQQANLGIEAQAEQRALDAMQRSMEGGRALAGDVFGREYQTGAAQDVVNQYNTQGQRDVQADTRSAQNARSDYLRNLATREAEAQRGTDLYNTDAENAARLRQADLQTEANQWGVETGNRNAIWNAEQEALEKADRAAQARGNIQGYNTQMENLADINIGRAGGVSGIRGTKQSGDLMTGLTNLTTLAQGTGKAAKDLGIIGGQ